MDPIRGYDFSLRELEHEISGRGLSAILLSNPCNPTGKLIAGDEMNGWVSVARRLDCTLLLDEFYSHYIWNERLQATDAPYASAAEHIEDVNSDPVLILDGLTKNWRYPGWRVAWTLGPKSPSKPSAVQAAFSMVVEAGLSSEQRFLYLKTTTHWPRPAIQDTFRTKRSAMIRRLAKMGIGIDRRA